MKGKTRIVVEGHLDARWEEWFDGMEISHEDKHTILYGTIKDESYLHGILNRIRDLNVKLVSVNSADENN